MPSNAIRRLIWVLLLGSMSPAWGEDVSPPPAEPMSEASIFSGADQIFSMIRNPRVQKEIELIDSQKRKIDEIVSRMIKARNEMNEAIRLAVNRHWQETKKHPDFDDPEFKKKLPQLLQTQQQQIQLAQQQVFEASATVARKEIEEVLLPHQRDRLKELANQRRAEHNWNNGSFLLQRNHAGVELSDEQKEQLKQVQMERNQKERELRREIEVRVQRFHAEWVEKTMEILTREQREQWDRVMGKKFRFDQPADEASSTGNAPQAQSEEP
jgi:Spy/CpxP family protein refolding chaperone